MASPNLVAAVVVGAMALVSCAAFLDVAVGDQVFPFSAGTHNQTVQVGKRDGAAFASSGYAYDRDMSLLLALSGTASDP
jgi:hypothetical protein